MQLLIYTKKLQNLINISKKSRTPYIMILHELQTQKNKLSKNIVGTTETAKHTPQKKKKKKKIIGIT